MGIKGKSYLAFSVLFLMFFMSMSATVWAQENMCVLPTGTEEVNELPSLLTVYASSEEISPSNAVYLRAAWGCPPYQWSVSGTGYSLSKTTTNGELDYTVLSVVGGTCGQQYAPYVTATVTDSCEGEDSTVIRNTGGAWINKGGPYVRCSYGGGDCNSCYHLYCAGGCSGPSYEIQTSPITKWAITGYQCNCCAGSGGNETCLKWCDQGGLAEESHPLCTPPHLCNQGLHGCPDPWEGYNFCEPDTSEKCEWQCPGTGSPCTY
jgi:hypothetical protein